MIKQEECVALVRESDMANRWLLVTLTSLLSIAIAAVLAFVFTRNLVISDVARQAYYTQQQELKRWEQLIETLPGGVALVNVENTQITYCNEGFRVLTGRTSSGLLGKSILTIIPEDAQSIHREMLLTSREETWSKYGLEQFLLPNGLVQWPDGTVHPHPIRIRGTRINGTREWVVFIDPRDIVIPSDTTKSRLHGTQEVGSASHRARACGADARIGSSQLDHVVYWKEGPELPLCVWASL